ncbi:cation:proton antiporter [Methanomicrobiaceae archaeon CYW5]|uniref:monovalent cation/H+ antiporter complex subunit F n=1 Tax=Methanovulcanius yangii TaxID=1789227 RepID=UPI0029C9E276|nr:monovalent cation/H+ antiporter complex subunit F [Methanovulcanius yangii]MBT8507754.1 cation:proton antiporter [Methanovulcanius yangii]
MIDIWEAALAVLFILILVVLIRLLKGPTAPDRVVALDAINTFTVCAILIFGVAYQETVYVDVAIVYALLSFVGTLYLAKLVGGDI